MPHTVAQVWGLSYSEAAMSEDEEDDKAVLAQQTDEDMIQEQRRWVARMKVRQGKSWRECANVMGLHSGRALRRRVAGSDNGGREEFVQCVLRELSEYIFQRLEPLAIESLLETMEKYKESDDVKEQRVKVRAAAKALDHSDKIRDMFTDILEIKKDSDAAGDGEVTKYEKFVDTLGESLAEHRESAPEPENGDNGNSDREVVDAEGKEVSEEELPEEPEISPQNTEHS